MRQAPYLDRATRLQRSSKDKDNNGAGGVNSTIKDRTVTVVNATTSTRKIGTDEVPAIGFGATGISALYGPADPDEERLKVLDTACDLGRTFWDTSDLHGDSEELIGKWFQRTGKRDKISTTKFGVTVDPFGKLGVNGSPEYVRSAVERSLKRLGVEKLDLYYLHRVDKPRPIEQTIRVMAELVKEGKVKYLGLSECSAATLRQAHAIHPIAAVQMEYSPFSLEIEDEKINLLKTCRKLGVQVSPDDFAEDDYRRLIPKFSASNFPNILRLANNLKEIGKKYDATTGQMALAWLLAQGDDIILIPGTKKIKYLKENFDGLKIKLSPDDARAIRTMVDESNAIQGGERYPLEFIEGRFADSPAEA